MVIRIAIIIVIVYGSPVIALLFSCIISICRFLGVSSLSTLHGDTCNEVPGLVWRQIEVCRNNPQTLYCISEGARKGIMECKAQFRYERWNCTTQRNLSVFGQTLTKGSKETAFIYAILSAGVVHAVTQSCSAGNLTDCSCDMNRYGEKDGEGWEWGGCSDNIHYGTWFCKMFVDAPDANSKRDTRNLMNIHNNEVGRRFVRVLGIRFRKTEKDER
uniref:Protein Wnt n=1 Tax=Octopus bimaculoides TaxID=37653 RepID=A0A0L8H9M9_OCTBM